MNSPKADLLRANEVVFNRWKVIQRIGEGTFSQIYSAQSVDPTKHGLRAAIKVEFLSAGPLKPVLEFETKLLQELQFSNRVCRYYGHGEHNGKAVLIMELLGDSMSLVRQTVDATHGVPVTKAVSLGLEMIECIEVFHKAGYVHRDIKASNFVRSLHVAQQGRDYCIIDFGLSKKHLEAGEVVPSRKTADFRGTSMYASLAAHRCQDLGRKDDMWSMFYVVMDFLRGELPWFVDAQKKNRSAVEKLKMYYSEEAPEELVQGLPGAKSLVLMMEHLKSLKYEDKPNYQLMRKLLHEVSESETPMPVSTEPTIDLKRLSSLSKEDTPQKWLELVHQLEQSGTSRAADYSALLESARDFNSFIDASYGTADELVAVQRAIFQFEKKVHELKYKPVPPPVIQSFDEKRKAESKIRKEAMQQRRIREDRLRQSLGVSS